MNPPNIIDMVKSGTGNDYRLVIDFEHPRIALMTGAQEPFWDSIQSVMVDPAFLRELKRNLDICFARLEGDAPSTIT